MVRSIGYVAYYYANDVDQLASQNALLGGCDRVYTDELRRSDDSRSELAAALVSLQPGDQLVVSDLAILAKSLPHLGRVINSVGERRAHLAVCQGNTGEPRVLSEDAIDGILVTVAVHVSLSNARALDGARSTGEPNGRPRILDDAGKRKLRTMLREGASQAEVCRELGLSRTSAWRYSKQLEHQNELAVV